MFAGDGSQPKSILGVEPGLQNPFVSLVRVATTSACHMDRYVYRQKAAMDVNRKKNAHCCKGLAFIRESHLQESLLSLSVPQTVIFHCWPRRSDVNLQPDRKYRKKMNLDSTVVQRIWFLGLTLFYITAQQCVKFTNQSYSDSDSLPP